MKTVLSWFKNKPFRKDYIPLDKEDYRNSYKEWEILKKSYVYDKYSRQLIEYPVWKHYKFYKTEQSAKDALRDFRTGWWNWAYYDYPGINREKEFPEIQPILTINRYKIIKRDPNNIAAKKE